MFVVLKFLLGSRIVGLGPTENAVAGIGKTDYDAVEKRQTELGWNKEEWSVVLSGVKTACGVTEETHKMSEMGWDEVHTVELVAEYDQLAGKASNDCSSARGRQMFGPALVVAGH